jgi:hypothetical protein
MEERMSVDWFIGWAEDWMGQMGLIRLMVWVWGRGGWSWRVYEAKRGGGEVAERVGEGGEIGGGDWGRRLGEEIGGGDWGRRIGFPGRKLRQPGRRVSFLWRRIWVARWGWVVGRAS